MTKFRVILRIPATLYAYHDIEAPSRDALEQRLQSQKAINDIVAEGEGHINDATEVDERGTWKVDGIGGTITHRNDQGAH